MRMNRIGKVEYLYIDNFTREYTIQELVEDFGNAFSIDGFDLIDLNGLIFGLINGLNILEENDILTLKRYGDRVISIKKTKKGFELL